MSELTPEQTPAPDPVTAYQVDLAKKAAAWQDGYSAGWLDADEGSPMTQRPNPYTLGGVHLPDVKPEETS